VHEATFLSCVDLLESGLQEYMTAIKNAVNLHPVITDKSIDATVTCTKVIVNWVVMNL
jgi:hypothetical protein